MSRKLMVDVSEGWKYGFPKFVGEKEGRELLDMTIDELYDYLVSNSYPSELATKNAGWCRFMWMEDKE